MSDEISVVQKEERTALCISDRVGVMKIAKIAGPAYTEILESLKKQGITPQESDIPFTLYRQVDWSCFAKGGFIQMIKMLFFTKLNLEMGIPCPDSAVASGRIEKKKIEAGKFIRTIHHGPYKKLGDTYNKALAFAATENLTLKDYSVEFYLNDPCITPEKELRTELLLPIE